MASCSSWTRLLTFPLLSLRFSSRSSPRTGSSAFCRADLRQGRVHGAENCGGSAVAVSCSWWSMTLSCRSSTWYVQFLDKVVDTPVVVQCVVKVAEVPVVHVLGGAASAVPVVVDVSVIMQRRWVSRTVESPQIQFIAGVCRHSSSQQRRVRTVQTVPLSAWVWWR